MVVASPGAAVAAGFVDVVQRVQAGVVMVEGHGRDAQRFGTGFLLSSPPVVITALHNVEGADRIRIVMPATFIAADARLLGASAAWDLAVLKISWPEEKGFPGLTLAEGTSPLLPGTEIAFTGFGFGSDGELMKVLATYRGIVSSHVPHHESSYYYLSAFVSRGLSGSPLYLPGTGEVVGVVTRHFGPPDLGYGFGGAVPGDVVRELVAGLHP